MTVVLVSNLFEDEYHVKYQKKKDSDMVNSI